MKNWTYISQIGVTGSSLGNSAAGGGSLASKLHAEIRRSWWSAAYHLEQKAQKKLLIYYTTSRGITVSSLSRRKSSGLVPLLKPGISTFDLASYHQIARASCVGNVIKQIIMTSLKWCMEGYDIYPVELAHFRRDRSCIDNVIYLVLFSKSRKRPSTHQRRLFSI